MLRTASIRRLLAGLALACGAAFGVHAAVVSPALNVPANPDSFLQFTWPVTADLPVAALNGVLTYDPAYFSDPHLSALPASAGFNVLGNEAVPGRFHFVIYANPTAALPLNTPVIQFSFRTSASLPLGPVQMIFKASPSAADHTGAAARVDGFSFGNDVTFHPITVQVQASSRDWALYE
jgi:hypothetical protein